MWFACQLGAPQAGRAEMSQRDSGYERRTSRPLRDSSVGVTAALSSHIRKLAYHVWEPACGSGAMAEALVQEGYRVTATHIATRRGFPQDRVAARISSGCNHKPTLGISQASPSRRTTVLWYLDRVLVRASLWIGGAPLAC
jgi:hypothetical protein